MISPVSTSHPDVYSLVPDISHVRDWIMQCTTAHSGLLWQHNSVHIISTKEFDIRWKVRVEKLSSLSAISFTPVLYLRSPAKLAWRIAASKYASWKGACLWVQTYFWGMSWKHKDGQNSFQAVITYLRVLPAVVNILPALSPCSGKWPNANNSSSQVFHHWNILFLSENSTGEGDPTLRFPHTHGNCFCILLFTGV